MSTAILLLLVLLVLLPKGTSGEVCLNSQQCITKLGQSTRCIRFSCEHCPQDDSLVPLGGNDCTYACSTPGAPAENVNCQALLGDPRANCMQLSAFDDADNVFINGNGVLVVVQGLCGICPQGFTNEFSACINRSSVPALSPSDIIGSPGSPEGVPANLTSPPPPEEATAGLIPFPKWMIGLVVSVGGGILAGFIGLIFYCGTNKHKHLVERRKYPFADSVAKKLQLRSVDNFDANPGLQFRSSIALLESTLQDREVVKRVGLLGNERLQLLAEVVSAELVSRYGPPTKMGEKHFLREFGDDCGDNMKRNVLACGIEDTILVDSRYHLLLVIPNANKVLRPLIRSPGQGSQPQTAASSPHTPPNVGTFAGPQYLPFSPTLLSQRVAHHSRANAISYAPVSSPTYASPHQYGSPRFSQARLHPPFVTPPPFSSYGLLTQQQPSPQVVPSAPPAPGPLGL